MDELFENLLFSMTLPEVAFLKPGAPPPARELRIAHNFARRRLAERYGFEEYQPLAERAELLCFARKNRWLMPVLLSGVGLWAILSRALKQRAPSN